MGLQARLVLCSFFLHFVSATLGLKRLGGGVNIECFTTRERFKVDGDPPEVLIKNIGKILFKAIPRQFPLSKNEVGRCGCVSIGKAVPYKDRPSAGLIKTAHDFRLTGRAAVRTWSGKEGKLDVQSFTSKL